MTTIMNRYGPRALAAGAMILAATIAAPAPAHAQWVQQHEQFYLQARHNWQFRDRYQAADRLFNAFDYGHAILYETLWTQPNAPASELEEREYDFLTKTVLVKPPRVPLEEGAIEIAYVKLVPEAKQMFEWAHVLHRQMYDVLADERLSRAEQDAEVQRLLAYYKTRRDVAFSSRPKSMRLMQEMPYSLAFRQRYPKFNGLIWGYHWLQVGLYEPLVVGTSTAERQAMVRATVSRFWQMVAKPVEGMPHQMPMTAAIAPTFAERYPEAAIIFDNLHSMHDVISDILANPAVPRDRKRAEILLAAERFRDDTSFVMTEAAWRTMSEHMGLENMGGPAVGFLPALPTPTVSYGAVMTHDDRTGEMTGFRYGQATGGAHAQHGAASGADTGAAAHAGHDTTAKAAADTDAHAGHDMTTAGAPGADAMALQMRMLEDPVIRQRVLADTAMHRMLMQHVQEMPAEHRDHLMHLMHPDGDASEPGRMRIPVSKTEAGEVTRPAARATETPAATRRASTPARRPAARPAATKPATKPAAKKPAPKPAPKPDPHAGHRPG